MGETSGFNEVEKWAIQVQEMDLKGYAPGFHGHFINLLIVLLIDKSLFSLASKHLKDQNKPRWNLNSRVEQGN